MHRVTRRFAGNTEKPAIRTRRASIRHGNGRLLRLSTFAFVLGLAQAAAVAHAYDARLTWRMESAAGVMIYVRYGNQPYGPPVFSGPKQAAPDGSYAHVVTGVELGPVAHFSILAYDGTETQGSRSNELSIDYATAAGIVDSDGDGLVDAREDLDLDRQVDSTETDPNDADTDGDGLLDGVEVDVYQTDPMRSDTDGDGFADGDEISAGSDPKESASNPDLPDCGLAAGCGSTDGPPPAPGCGDGVIGPGEECEPPGTSTCLTNCTLRPLVDVTQQAAIVARVTKPLGGGSRDLEVIRDGDKPPLNHYSSSRQYDTWDGTNTAAEDWIGYRFDEPHTFTELHFQEGKHFADGGWFEQATVQVLSEGRWTDVSGLAVDPAYPGLDNGVDYESYRVTFDPVIGDGVRVYGRPGGSADFISVAELEVFALAHPCAGSNPDGSGSTCDDGDPCTEDSCTIDGCVHEHNSAPCDDGLSCTVSDVCSAGVCEGIDACTGGGVCDRYSGVCKVADDTEVWLLAALDPSARFTGAMTTGPTYAAGSDGDAAANSLAPLLLYADSARDAYDGITTDRVEYTVDIPRADNWYLWGRFYYPGPHGAGANSFFVSVDDDPTLLRFGNNHDYVREWHWDGDGEVGVGDTVPLDLGWLPEGSHTLTVWKREVTPIPPRLDVLLLTRDASSRPSDASALEALGPIPSTTTTLPSPPSTSTTTTVDPTPPTTSTTTSSSTTTSTTSTTSTTTTSTTTTSTTSTTTTSTTTSTTTTTLPPECYDESDCDDDDDCTIDTCQAGECSHRRQTGWAGLLCGISNGWWWR